jgi:hypothetical protein
MHGIIDVEMVDLFLSFQVTCKTWYMGRLTVSQTANTSFLLGNLSFVQTLGFSLDVAYLPDMVRHMFIVSYKCCFPSQS